MGRHNLVQADCPGELIGFLLDRAIFLVLAYALFKVLTREATRYRMTSPDIPPSMRL